MACPLESSFTEEDVPGDGNCMVHALRRAALAAGLPFNKLNRQQFAKTVGLRLASGHLNLQQALHAQGLPMNASAAALEENIATDKCWLSAELICPIAAEWLDARIMVYKRIEVADGTSTFMYPAPVIYEPQLQPPQGYLNLLMVALQVPVVPQSEAGQRYEETAQHFKVLHRRGGGIAQGSQGGAPMAAADSRSNYVSVPAFDSMEVDDTGEQPARKGRAAGKRKQPSSSGTASNRTSTMLNGGGARARLPRLIAWPVNPAVPGGELYIAAVGAPGADTVHLCWRMDPCGCSVGERAPAPSLVPSPRLVLVRLSDGSLVAAPGEASPPHSAPRGLGAMPSKHHVRVYCGGPQPWTSGIHPRFAQFKLTELVIIDKQKQRRRWLFSTADFEADNEPMLTSLRAACADVSSGVWEMLERERAESGPPEPDVPLDEEDGRQRTGNAGADPNFFQQMLSKGAAAVASACAAAGRQPDHSQAYTCLSELSIHENDIKGTAMELIVAAVLHLKGTQLTYRRSSDGTPCRGSVCRLGDSGAPAIWISRAPPGCNAYMDPVQVMPEVAGWFDNGSEELRAELVKVFKDLMLKDAGFDILAVVEHAADNAQKHMLWLQVKYRSLFTFPSGDIDKYVGRFKRKVLDPLKETFSACAAGASSGASSKVLAARLHFMWASNQQHVAKAMHDFPTIRIYGFPEFERDWEELRLLDALPACTAWLAATSSRWRDLQIKGRPPVTAMEEQAASVRGIHRVWRGMLPRATLIAPTGSGKTEVSFMAFVTSAAAAADHDLAERAMLALETPHSLRTPQHMRDFHYAYSRSLKEALLPLVFFAPSIELARQSLQRYLSQHYRWQHALREELGAAAEALPDVKCALVCSDDTPFADTGDVLLLCARDVERILLPYAHNNPNEKWLVFTTMQGSQAFKLHLRKFAIANRHQYAFGCTADGRPLVLSGQRPMVGTVIHDEAHNMTGAHSKPFTRALLVSSQLSARSLSLTATPMEAKERMDAKAAKQRDLRLQRREDLKRQKLSRQAQRKQAVQQPQNNMSDGEGLLAEQQQTSEAAEEQPLDAYASDSDDGRELDGSGGFDSSDDDDLEDAVRLLDVPNAKFVPQIDDTVPDATGDKQGLLPKSTAIEQAFPWDERMELVSLQELAARLGTTRPALGQASDTALLEDHDALMSAVAAQTGRPVVLVQASTESIDDELAFPLERDSNPGGNVHKTRHKWQWLGARVPAKGAVDLAEMPDDDADKQLLDLGVLDPDLHAHPDLIVIGHAERAGLALFGYEGNVGEPRRGPVVHDQSGMWYEEEPAGRPWNGNGHGRRVGALGWSAALRVRDRMAGISDLETTLPHDTAPDAPLFVPFLRSHLASLVEPLTPGDDPMRPRAGDPMLMAYFVRRLLLRCSYSVVKRSRTEAWDDENCVDQDMFAPGERWTSDATLDQATRPGALWPAIKAAVERAVALATNERLSVLWWRCDLLSGRPEKLTTSPDISLEAALPLGYIDGWQPGMGLEDLLFPTGPPRRRRSMVLAPSLVLLQQPFLPYGIFASDSFTSNLFGLVSEVRTTGAAAASPASVELQAFEAAEPYLRNAAQQIAGTDASWVEEALEVAYQAARNAQIAAHPDRGGPGGDAFCAAHKAVTNLQEARRSMNDRQQSELQRLLRSLGGSDQQRVAPGQQGGTVPAAQPQQVKFECTIEGVVFRCTLQHLLTARMLVSAMLAQEPLRRNKMVVFAQTNAEAALLQLLVRALLSRHPGRDVYDAHVFTSMSLGGQVEPKSQAAEENARILGKFRREPRAILFNSNYLAEGFDCPAIDAVAICFACKSPRKIIQMIGRAMRVDSWNPDKVPMVLLPVHDPQAVTDVEFGPIQEGLAAGQLSNFAQAERQGAELPFTPFQTSFDVVRKYLECMCDSAVQTITRAFHLSMKGDRSGSYQDRTAVLNRPVSKLLETLIVRMNSGRGGFAPMHLGVSETGAVLKAAETLGLMKPCSTFWDKLDEVAEFSRNNNGKLPRKANSRPVTERRLAYWCLWQRLRRRGSYGVAISAAEVEALNKLPDWRWDFADRWQLRYEELVQWLDRHSNMPRKPSRAYSASEAEASLAKWCTRQRELYRHGNLSPKRKALLDDISEWNWPDAAQPVAVKQSWASRYKDLQAFVDKFGRQPEVKAAKGRPLEPGEGSLATWRYGQRKKWDSLSQQQQDQLLKVMPGWSSSSDDIWHAHYRKLQEFLAESGGDLPGGKDKRKKTQVSEEESALYKWVSKQRAAKRSERNPLTNEQVKLLEGLAGWSWGAEDDWNNTLAKVAAFVVKHGRTPTSGKTTPVEEKPLGQWLNKQRMKKRGSEKPPLTPAQIARLDCDIPGWFIN